jgi:hypothetical protein
MEQKSRTRKRTIPSRHKINDENTALRETHEDRRPPPILSTPGVLQRYKQLDEEVQGFVAILVLLGPDDVNKGMLLGATVDYITFNSNGELHGEPPLGLGIAFADAFHIMSALTDILSSEIIRSTNLKNTQYAVDKELRNWLEERRDMLHMKIFQKQATNLIAHIFPVCEDAGPE